MQPNSASNSSRSSINWHGSDLLFTRMLFGLNKRVGLLFSWLWSGLWFWVPSGWLEKFHRSIIHLIRMTSAPTSGIRRALNRNYDSGGERTTKCSSKQFSPLAAIKSLRAFYDPSFTIRIKRHLSVPSLPDEEQGRYHLYRPLLKLLPVRGEIIFIIV